MPLAPLAHVPRCVAAQVAGLSVAVVDGAEVATVVTATLAELLTAEECLRAAALLSEAARMLDSVAAQASANATPPEPTAHRQRPASWTN